MKMQRRLLAALLMLVLLLGMMPAMALATPENNGEIVPPQAAAEVVTAEAEELLQQDVLGALQTALTPKRGEARELSYYYEISDSLKQIVLASDTYIAGSLVERGDAFFWQTSTGITCGYTPQHEYEMANLQPVAAKTARANELTNFNYANADRNDVCLVCPMYANDSSFTENYGQQTVSIASAVGGKGYRLLNTDATVETIAQALEKCGVVLFDSHGNTDWGYFSGGSDGTGDTDCTSQANTSYLCLTSGEGMTAEDMAMVTGSFGTYPHAYSDVNGNYVADGTAIANHMSTDAPDSLLWMGICQGMSTNGLCQPLRDKGVGVVYGYSQSVSFDGDNAYLEEFWPRMIAGSTVAGASAEMKQSCGNWDPGYAAYNLTQTAAVSNYWAFPVVASAQDAYPGQGNVDALQTVQSTWTLLHDITLECSANGTASVSGNTITVSPQEGYTYTAAVTAGTAELQRNGNTIDVTPSTDCTVAITFVETQTVSISFVADRAPSGSRSAETGEVIVLPDYTEVPNGAYTFLGWTEQMLTETTARPKLYAAGASYTVLPTGEETGHSLYAVFTRTQPGAGEVIYTLVTDMTTLYAGQELVIACNTKGLVAGEITNSYMTPIAATFSDNREAITGLENEADFALLTLGGTAGAWTLAGRDGALLCAQTLKKLAWDDGSNTWSINIINDNAVIANTNEAYGRFLYYATDPRFNTYAATTSTTASRLLPQLYRKSNADLVTFTTNVTECTHEWTLGEAVTESCTQEGYTPRTCALCGANERIGIIAALGHSFGAYESNDDGLAHTRSCARCTQTEEQPCSWNSGAQTLAPAGEVPGVMTYTCTVCMGHKTAPVYTVRCHNAGDGTVITRNVVDGETVSKPADPTAPENYTFLYWSSVNQSQPLSTGPEEFDFASTPITGNTDLYAVYAIAAVIVSESETYELVTDPSWLTAGSKVIIAAAGFDYAMSTTQNGNNRARIAITKDGNTILPTEGVETLTLGAGNIPGTYSLYSESSNGYLYAASNSGNYLRTEETLTNNSSWKIEIMEGAVASVVSQGSFTRATMQYYSTSTSGLFGCYLSATQKPLALYAKGGRTLGYVGYTTDPATAAGCEHPAAQAVAGIAATCTAGGNIAYWECPNCGKLYTDAAYTTEVTLNDTLTTALGHDFGSYLPDGNSISHTRSCSRCPVTETENCSWDEGVQTVVPTASTAGQLTYTCAVCGVTRTEELPALGALYSVQFSVPEGVAAVDGMSCYQTGTITLPGVTGTPLADAQSYVFAGWAAVDVENTAQAPTVYTAGSSYTAPSDVTLRAVYTYEAGATGRGGDYVRVSAVPADWSGEYLIVNETESLAFNGGLPGLDVASNYKSVTIDGDAIAAAAGDPCRFIFTAYEPGVIICSRSGFYIGMERDENGLTAAYDTAYLNTITLNEDNSVNICSNGGAYLRFNTTSGQDRFRYYTSSTYTRQRPISLFAKNGTAPTTFYTTTPEYAPEHTHTAAYSEAVSPTCTEPGTVAYYYCSAASCPNADKRYADEALSIEIPAQELIVAALGHTVADDAAVPATCTATGLTAGTHCSVCDVVLIAQTTVAALGHDWDAGTVTTPASCTQTGTRTFACSRCDATDTETISATGHTVVDDAAVPATCTTTGLTAGTHCSVCEEVLTAQQTVAALGHDYTYTDNNDGTHAVACTRCDYTATEACNTTGTDGACSLCGYLAAPDTTIALTINNTLSLEGATSLNYFVGDADLAAYDSCYMSVEHLVYNSATAAYDAVDTRTIYAQDTLYGGRYRQFIYTNIPASELNDTLRATLHAFKDGTEYTTEATDYSAVSYCYAIANRETSKPTLRTTMANLIQYAAAAQVYFNHDTEHPATANWTTALDAIAIMGNPTMAKYTTNTALEGQTAAIKTLTLDVQGRVGMTFYVLPSAGVEYTECNLVVTYNDVFGAQQTVTVPGSEWVYYNANYGYKATMSNLNAPELREIVSAVVVKDEAVISNTYTYSVETYAQTMVERAAADPTNLTRVNLAALMQVMINYSDAAKNHFAG